MAAITSKTVIGNFSIGINWVGDNSGGLKMTKIFSVLIATMLFSSMVFAADVKISALPAATALDGSETTVLVQSGVTKKAAISLLLPSQTGNSGKVLTTDGTNTSWTGNLNITSVTGAAITAKEVDGHTDVTLAAVDVSSTIIYNTGQAATDVALTLPTAAVGYSFIATVGTAQSNKWGVRAATNDKIYLLNADGTISAGSDNGYARMTAAQVGQAFVCWTFKTDAYDWMCKPTSIGTSTFAAN